MQNQIKAVLWDVGGVLYRADFSTMHHEFGEEIGVGGEKLIELFKEHKNLMAVGEMSFEGFIDLLKKHGAGNHDFKKIWIHILAKHIVLNQPVFALIARLRPQTTMAILTNVTESRDLFDQHIDLYKGFDKVFRSYKIGLKKPERPFYLHALKELNIKPSEAILVDDLQPNIDTAHQLGMHGILYKNYGQLCQDLNTFGIKT